MIDEILQSSSLDKCLKSLDKRNFFYPGAKILGKLLRTLLWKYKETDFNIYAIGQSHLDAAWLWRRRDTIRKNNVTFSNALKHMADYPFFTFTCSSPQYFEWMEKYFPEKFEKIKERVKEGRLELVGGMWIEPDLNVTSGESLVRQRLYGQRYYLEKFGKISDIEWISDSFGYPWALPQIAAKSGARYFYTNKMSWNSVTRFPFIIFYWQSPDGSKILTYSMPYSLNLVMSKPGMAEFKQYTRTLENVEQQRVFNYESKYEEIDKRRTGDYIHDLGFIYGMGDGGGGPLRLEIIYLKEFLRHKQIKGFSTMHAYFEKLEQHKETYPIWNDEMYLEIHQGTYTAQVWLKELNRKTEFDFYNLELMASLSSLFGWQYPAEKIRKLWKLFLFNQFHDILPGSAIPAVYQDTRNDFKKISAVSTRIKQSALEALLPQINIPAKGLIVFNNQSWKHDALIELDKSQKSIIKDKNGTEIPSQITENKQIFIAKDMPSLGYTFFSIESAAELPSYGTDLSAHEEEKVMEIENAFLKVRISKKSGSVLSIYHKTLEKEILTAPGNKLLIYKEKLPSMNPAWNINPNYNQTLLKLDEAVTVVLKEMGPVRILVEVQRKSLKPSILIIQQICLLSNLDRIDFKLVLKYHVNSTIVKLAFPLNVETDKINCEMAFGVITRTTKPQTRARQAQWEIPAHKWVDISQNDYGVSLINKSRYGFDAHYHTKYKNIVRMTIGRIPIYPHAGNPLFSILPTRTWHEQAEYSVDYSLYIHKNDWKTAKPFLLANEFNNPPIQIPVDKSEGQLPAEFEFLQLQPTNVLLSALKLPEDHPQKALVLRVYETTGKATNAEIIFSQILSLTAVSETDLLELNPKKCKFEKNSFSFPINPFEIKTFLITCNRST